MANRLANATSPYLLQHAGNPVHWNEWGPEALAQASARDKPILLSVGYAACHWCHVMERESFEDNATAAIMNEHFVSIKVDREERPDIDAIYMDAVQSMTGRGGWPMTVFCAPDGTPLYGGTYFPPDDRHGLPSFKRVLLGIADAWANDRAALSEQGAKLLEMIGRGSALSASGTPDLSASTLRVAFETLRPGFDPEWGGFGQAPKFPQPMNLDFLLRAIRLGEQGVESMLAVTLDRMARGGIFDHIGGGFARYSTDEKWHVPHFEKMLYDNGQLLGLYARAALFGDGAPGGPLDALGDELRATATATADFLLREMRAPGGGFYSAIDADSEGVEGKFSVWTREEFQRVLDDVLSESDIEHLASLLDVTENGNWEGSTVLWIPRRPEQVERERSLQPGSLTALLDRARGPLLAARAQRIRPATDDKILASWNGLAISGLAAAGRALKRDDLIAAARDAAAFVLEHLRDATGRLHRSWREGRTSGPAYLDDYALMAAGLLDLYETVFDESLFTHARELADEMLRLFTDPKGGFFDTGSDAESLIVRPKDLYDNAIPSGGSSAARVLLRLAALTGERHYDDAARSALRIVQTAMTRAPHGFGAALCALDDAVSTMKEVAIAGDPSAPETLALAAIVWARPALPTVIAAGDPASSIVPLLQHRESGAGSGATAYVCEHFTCMLPVTEPSALAALLQT